MDFDDDKHPRALPPARMEQMRDCPTAEVLESFAKHAVLSCRYTEMLVNHKRNLRPKDIESLSRLTTSTNTTEMRRATRRLTKAALFHVAVASMISIAELNCIATASVLESRGVPLPDDV